MKNIYSFTNLLYPFIQAQLIEINIETKNIQLIDINKRDNIVRVSCLEQSLWTINQIYTAENNRYFKKIKFMFIYVTIYNNDLKLSLFRVSRWLCFIAS